MKSMFVLITLLLSLIANAQEAAILTPPDGAVFYNDEISSVLQDFESEIAKNAQSGRKVKIIIGEYALGSTGLIFLNRPKSALARNALGVASVAMLGKAAYDTTHREHGSLYEARGMIERSKSMNELYDALWILVDAPEKYWERLQSDLVDDILNLVDLKESAKKRCAHWSARIPPKGKPADILQKCEEAVLKSLSEPKPEPPKKAEGRRHARPAEPADGHGRAQ